MVIPSRTNKSYWRGKLVFVTGVTGFVGSSLTAKLLELGAKVVGLIPDEPRFSNFYLIRLDKKITIVRGHLESHRTLQRVIQKYKFDVVYHLGAQAIVGKANSDPVPTFQTNIRGTWNLLEACRPHNNIKAIVIASSDKAYGTHKILPYKEHYPLQPEHPYDTSKACADLIAQTYYKFYGLPVVITRFANIYGPGDLNFSRIIPDTIRSVLNGKYPVIRSDGTPERDFLYINDVVDLYLLLAEKIKLTKGEILNAGHNKPIRILDLVKTIIRLAGKKNLRPRIQGKGKLRGEIDRQWLNAKKVKRLLGWSPNVMLKQGLQKTIEWHYKIHRTLKTYGKYGRGLDNGKRG